MSSRSPASTPPSTATHPFVNDVFALPRHFYDEGVRRYGFHGLSYEYITGRLRKIAPLYAAGRVVVAHLGNGASMCAIRDGHSIASSMGFTALDGLPMGTRCGQLDPGVVLYLMQEKKMSAEEIADLLYRESGLKGLSGVSNDMRELEASDKPEAQEAIEYFVFRIRRELGGLAAVLKGLDAIVFCGGIGEHAWRVRERVLEGMEWIGVELDRTANRASAADHLVGALACARVRHPDRRGGDDRAPHARRRRGARGDLRSRGQALAACAMTQTKRSKPAK